MKKLILSAGLLLALMTVNILAQAQQKTDPCENAQTTVEMRDCAGKEYRRADAELNGVYQQLMSKLDDAGYKSALRISEQDWIKYRDANCEFESYLNKGGTIYPVVYEGCRTRMTVARTNELREMLKQE